MPGLGTLVNVTAIIVGSAVGLALGHRLPERTREVTTGALGLVTLLLAALSAAEVTGDALTSAVGPSAPMLIVLGSLLIGGVAGSLLRLEDRLDDLGAAVRRLLDRAPAAVGGRRAAAAGAEPAGAEPAGDGGGSRFVEGFVTSSLVFVVGPLAILGAINDGLGNGIDQLALKAALDGFAAVAFAAGLGVGVMASAGPVLVYQGAFTVLGVAVGNVLSDAAVAALTATGGLLLAGVALRLLRIRALPVADLLPALLVAPQLTAAVAAF
ncbi:DUF554 domain-containing protein [Nocardiopsis trehalosi]|uniref:DUF554 domain-containing protein n=1 Tax=Nocardiopsis trehalosi TaxID=109329 RepID=UPI00083632CE|nr:DUF554 domain-containing protein [Nocardiopsis trehalosi]